MTKENENKIRAFICLKIPPNLREAIDRQVISILRKTGVKCSWVKPDNIHLTLKFLGDIPQVMVPEISNKIAESVLQIPSLNLSSGKIGTFGGRIPRVVWVGFEGDIEPLTELAKSIDSAMKSLGFKPEKRRFSPHITIGRVRNTRNVERLIETIDRIELEKIDITLNKIILMKSTLSPQGSIYSPLATFDIDT